MPTMVDFPTLVQDAVDVLGDLVANEPARRHCAAYLSRLRGAEKQPVSGIHGAFGVTTDPAGRPRWRHEVPWDVQALHNRRWAWWQGAPKTRSSPRGGMARAQTLVAHGGQLSADVGWFWDQANAPSVIAPEALISNDVGPSGAHDPMAWRRCKKKAACQQGEGTDHPAWCLELSHDAIARHSPGDCTCASSCTRAQVLNHMQSTTRAHGGELKRHRPRVDDGREPSLQAVARQRPWQAQNPVRVGHRRDGDFRKPRRIPEGPQPGRMGWCWQERDQAEASKALGSHGLPWEVRRMGGVSRHRWPGTAPWQRDGKPEWGLGAVSEAPRRGADPPGGARQRRIQSAEACAPPAPAAGVGSAEADAPRRSLAGGPRRTAGAAGRLAGGQARR
jgi:hypothetical protein